MKIALFYGHYSSNVGDVAINRGLADLLKSSFGEDFSLTVFFMNGDGEKLNGRSSFGEYSNINFEPVYVDVSLALESVQAPEIFLQKLGVSDFDLILINGGEHLFSLRSNPNWTNLFWRSLPLISATSNRLQSLVLPSTIGPFENESGMQYAENFLKGPSSFLCRDVQSFEYLKNELGIESAKLLPDLAFSIDFDDGGSSEIRQSETVGMIVRPDKMGLRVGAEESVLKSAAFAEAGYGDSLSFKFALRAAKKVLDEDSTYLKIFIQTNADKQISEELYRTLRQHYDTSRFELVTPDSIDDYLRQLSTCGCIITSRLHAAILSFVVDTPCVAYYFEEHGHKMPGAFELLSATDSYFLLNEKNLEEYADSILERIEKAKEAQPHIAHRIDDLKNESIEYFRGIPKSTLTTVGSGPLAEFPEWLAGVSSETAAGEVKVALMKKNERVRQIYDAHARSSERLRSENKNLKKENRDLKNRSSSIVARNAINQLKTKLRKFLNYSDRF